MMPGDGGGNGWEYQVDGTVPAKANGARGGGSGGGESLGHTGGMARAARDQHVGRGRERIWQEIHGVGD